MTRNELKDALVRGCFHSEVERMWDADTHSWFPVWFCKHCAALLTVSVAQVKNLRTGAEVESES